MRSLIYVGYPKTGTSFVSNWFQQHPQIRYQGRSLGGLRDTKALLRDAAMSERADIRYFVTSDESITNWRGDVDIVGMKFKPYDVQQFQSNACMLLKQLFPTSTILITTRGYEGIIRSSYSQYVRRGGAWPFSEYLTNMRDMMKHAWNYNYLIQLYRDAFGDGNVIVLPYEFLEQDVLAYIRFLEERLNLDTHPEVTERVNPALPLAEQHMYRTVSSKLVSLLKPFSRRTQERLYGSYAHLLYRGKLDFFMRAGARSRRAPMMAMDVPQNFLQDFASNSSILRSEPLFQPYLDHYLPKNETASPPGDVS